jgi:site-specific DNA recombinase
MQNKRHPQEEPNGLPCAIYTRDLIEQGGLPVEAQKQHCREEAQQTGQTVRAALYTRSAIYDPASLARQQEFCRVTAAEHSWQVDDLVFSDSGKSRLTGSDREGLNSLLQVAAEQPRPFDYVLVESIDRISRNRAVVIQIVDTLASHGVGVYFAAERLDSQNTSFRVLVTIVEIFNEQFIRAVRAKALKSSSERVRLGYTPGGRYFGYESFLAEVPVTGNIRNRETRAKLRIVPEEAETIRRIYRLFADGLTMQAIALRLTNEGVPGPGKNTSVLWNARLVSRLLQREHYRGLIVWNRSTRVRDPLTGRIMKRRKPENEIVRMSVPELRIVDEDLATAVKRRLSNVHTEKPVTASTEDFKFIEY